MSYDMVARQYIESRQNLKSSSYVRAFAKYLKPHSVILDLGCGAGEPVDDILLKLNHHVIGIDLSPQLIAYARKSCKGGEYSVGDIRELKTGQYAVNGVVSLYSFFHIPRGEHGKLLKIIASYLPIGGILLISLGDKDFEGYAEFLGTRMWWSQWGPSKNRELVKSAGLKIILDEINSTGGERHHMILAEKIT